MARRPRGAAKKNARRISVDMSDVEARVTLPEGDYRVKVAEITQEEGQNAPYLKWKYEVLDGKFKGKSIYDNTSLAPQALWRLANLLTTLGVEVPKGELDIDFDEIEGLEVTVVVEHEDYEGRAQARITDFYPTDGDGSSSDDDDDEDEKPAKKGKAKAAEPDDDEDDDEDEKPVKRGAKAKKPADDDDEDDDDDEEEEKPVKRGRGRPAGSKNKPKPSDDDDEDDDEEEEEKPAKRGKGTKAKAPTPQEIEDMDEDELEDVIEKHNLDVDLSDYRTLRKKQAAVIEALT